MKFQGDKNYNSPQIDSLSGDERGRGREGGRRGAMRARAAIVEYIIAYGRSSLVTARDRDNRAACMATVGII